MNSKDGESMPKFDASLLQILLEEIRNLRVQLQKSIDTNIALKERLEEQLGASFHASGEKRLECVSIVLYFLVLA